MCIPIELAVPVTTLDRQDIGIAREILCPCPGDVEVSATADYGAVSHAANDLWLRVTRPARPDLYIPFSEIAETRADGVLLRVTEDALVGHAWTRPLAGVPIPA